MDKLLVNSDDACRMLGVGRSLFYSMASTGRLGPMPVVFNSKKLWSVSELRAWVVAGCPIRDDWQMMQEAQK